MQTEPKIITEQGDLGLGLYDLDEELLETEQEDNKNEVES